jgi:hypothetical protein
MCILCGGQCGGIGEFLISIGLPFLALYFFRIKNALKKIINKFLPRDPDAVTIHDKVVVGGDWDKSSMGGRSIPLPPIDLKDINLLEVNYLAKPPTILPIVKPKFNEQINSEKGGVQGVKGWLLLLCLSLSIILPALYLYQLNITLTLFKSKTVRALLIICNESSIYFYIILSITMVFLAIFSFWAGLRLWGLKPNAVRTTKLFLLTQLALTFIIDIIRPAMAFPLGDNEGFGEIIGSTTSYLIRRLIPSLNYLSLTLGNKEYSFPLPHISPEWLSVLIIIWYFYLNNSRRVRNTYIQINKENSHQIRHPIDILAS